MKPEEFVKPEDVGHSSARLARVGTHLARYIEAQIAGALALVARRGHVAYCEPPGHLEIERRRPVTRYPIFRIHSMTKPIASVALMMLYEQGMLQLAAPVYRFIPSWKSLLVFVSGNHPAFVTVSPPSRSSCRRCESAAGMFCSSRPSSWRARAATMGGLRRR